ncbi:MAG: DoxX family protein [Proteobacteria bacterium]|nr:DoxX family protein [Pseudomonadota bacterium]
MPLVKRALLFVMGGFYVFAGVAHFTRPEFYLRIMPDYLPWHLELVYLSGVAEIALGVAVLVPRLRSLAAWGLIALLIAVFPANVHAAVNGISVGDADPVWNWVRLPFQGVFIAWAWWYTGEAASNRGAAPNADTA